MGSCIICFVEILFDAVIVFSSDTNCFARIDEFIRFGRRDVLIDILLSSKIVGISALDIIFCGKVNEFICIVELGIIMGLGFISLMSQSYKSGSER